MPRFPDGSSTVTTFRDLIEEGYKYHATCGACHRALDCDVFDMAEIFGLDTVFIRRKFPLKCAACGSRDISSIITPDVRNPSLWGTRPANQGKASRKSIPPHLDLWAKRAVTTN